MNEVLKNLLKDYTLNTQHDYENALKEIIQHLALLGLWRDKFFEHAAFYGGTALRIFYGLNRFSEDLDFSLLKTNRQFSLTTYCQSIINELKSVGLTVTCKQKEKYTKSNIESAFIKADTIQNFINIEVPEAIRQLIPKTHTLKIKLEIDINPPLKGQTEVKSLLTPIPFQVRVYTPDCLFAGKLHALLFRKWKTRIKGRDYYDFVWFISQKIPVNIQHLNERMKQNQNLSKTDDLSETKIKALLKKHFKTIDFNTAKQDILPFLKDPMSLDLWDKDFFISLTDQIIFT